MDHQEYLSRVRNAYIHSDPKEYGTADMSSVEVLALRAMVNEANSVVGGRRVDALARRNYIISAIIENGLPYPLEVTPEDLGEAAVLHGCVVAESLADSNKEALGRNTIISYSIKDRFDRYVQHVLTYTGRFDQSPDLRSDWFDPEIRKTDVIAEVTLPEGLDPNYVYGVSKTKRFLPAQLMKNLELERLKMKRTKDYTVEWECLETLIMNARNTEDIAVGVPLVVVDQLLMVDRGELAPTVDEVVDLIFNGYKPTGPIKEHVNVHEVADLWQKIINSLVQLGFSPSANPVYIEVAAKLVERVNTTMDEFATKYGENYSFELTL